MKCTSTLSGNLKKPFFILISCILITLISIKSYGQAKNYATITPSTGLVSYPTLLGGGTGPGNTNPGSGAGSILNPDSAATSTNTGFATLSAKYFNLLVVGSEGEAWIQVKYPQTVAAGKTTYIRFDQPTTTGLSLDLLNLVGNLTGLLKQNVVQLDVYSGASNGNANVGTQVDTSNVRSNVVRDASGANYFAVTSKVAYNSVRIRLRFRGNLLGLALGAAVNMKVYNAFTIDSENCAPSIFATVGESTGVNVTLTQLINNPERAVDNNMATFSQLQAGVVGLGSTISQTIYLNGLSTSDDYAKVVLSVPPSILTLDLFNNVTLQAYNGSTPVGSATPVSSVLLNLDLLGLFANQSIVPVYFKPGLPFDRVRISMGKVLAVGGNILSGGLNVHEVQRTVAKPGFAGVTNGAANVCGNQVTLNVSNPDAGFTYNWYRKTGATRVLLAGASGPSYSESGLVPDTYTYYLTAQKAGCTAESDIDSAKITVTAIPVTPTATAAAVCSGSPAVFAVTNPVAGQVYNWYTTAAGGTIAFTGASFTTPTPLTADATYFVEAVNGTCVSAARTSVTATVNPIPADAQVATNSVTITSGQTATLEATAPTAGSVINWYTVPAGGLPVATGVIFTTGPLTTTTTYYVGTQSVGGCFSVNRIPVTVNVSGVTPGLTCNAANAQQSGVNALLCVACQVTDPTNSTDADPNNFTRISLAVGVGATGYQRLIFPNAGVATDSIRLDLNLPGGVLDASVLGGITVNVMNGANIVKTYQLNSNLVHLQLLTGNRFKTTVAAGAVYDRVEVRFGGTVTALSSLDIYGAQVIYPNPTVANTGQAICSGSGTTLNATANGGTTIKWYSLPAGGTLLATGATLTTDPLTTTTTYYIEVSKGGCANEQRVPVTVTVNPTITFAAATLTNATVGSAYSKQIPVATGGTPAFTYTLANGSTLPAGLTLSAAGVVSGTPTATSNGSFTVLATDSKGCTATAVINLTATPGLVLPAATLPNGTVGTPYPVQTIPAASGGTTPYTYAATNLPPGLTFDPVTRNITGTPTLAGTYPVRVTVTDVNGNSIFTDYTIVVKDALALPPATLADGTVGIGYPVQIIPSATGGTGPYIYEATNLPPGLIFNPTTREISGNPTTAGTSTVTVKVTDAEGRTITNTYSIKIKAPLVLATATLADGFVGTAYASQPLPGATGGTTPYTYAATNLPPGLTFDPATRIISGNPTQSGLYTVSVTVTDGESTKVTTTYSLRVIGALSLPGMALADGTVGSTYPAQTLPEVTGGTGPYTYTANNLPPGLSFNTTTRQLSGTPTLGGTFTFSITAKDANNNSTNTDYTVQVKVGAPTADPTTVCAGSPATLSVTNVLPGVTYNWYAATGNTVVGTGSTFTTPALSASTTYNVEAVSGTALSSRTPVAVTVRPAPALATVTSGSQTISSGQTATLQASAEAGNTINWYAAATGGASLTTGNTFTTPALTTTTTYYIETQSAAGCVSLTRVPVTVTVSSGPVNPNCNAATGQQTGINGICLLCNIDGPGNSTDANPNNFTKISLAVGVGASGYQRLIFQNPGVATDSIRLDLESPVGLADVGLLTGVTVKVMNGTTVVSTYTLSSPLLSLQLLNGNRFNATVAAGGVYDRVEVSFGGLASVLTSLNIYGAQVIYPNPTVAASGQTVCEGSTTTLTATANGGTTLNWYAAATGGASLGTGGTFTTGALTANTTFYIEVSKAGCANAQRIPVTVTVTPAPAVPAFATVLPVCYGSSSVLSVDNAVTGLTYNWYTAASGGTPIFTGSTFTTPGLTANTTYYVESVSSGCGSSTRTAVIATVNPALALPQIQASATTVNPGQTVILNASSTDADVTFNWYNAANSATPVYTGATYVTPPLTTTVTYYLEAKSNATGCVSPNRVQVTITVNTGGVPNPVPCEAPIAQTNGVNGVALLAGVFNPELAIDNDTQTGSSLVMPVGLLGASVYQRVSFGSLSSVGDTVKVLLTSPGKLLSLGLLSTVQVGTYNGATSNNDGMALNNSALQISLLSGNTQALVSFVPASQFDQVEVLLNAGLAGVLSTVDLNYAQRILVAPKVVASNVTACATQTALLQVSNPNPLITYKWYDATGGNLVGQGATFTTPVLTTNTKFFVEANSASGCTSYKTQVNVTVTPTPDQPQLLADNVLSCAGSSVILTVGNPQPGFTYIWRSGATILQSGPLSTYTIASVTAPETYTVTAQNSCGVTSAAATATVDVGTPTPPTITPNSATINKNEKAVLTATSTSAGATFTWYDSDPALPGAQVVSTPGNGENGTFLTPSLSVTTTYWVTSTSGLCTSAASSVVVTVLGDPTQQDVPCEAATAQENGVGGVASILAGVDNPNQVFDNNINTGSSLRIPVGIGSFVYQRAIFTGLSTAGDKVRLKLVSPNKVLSLGLLSSVEITTYNGTISNGDTQTLNNAPFQVQLLPGDKEAIIEFTPTSIFDRVEVRLNSGLLSALTSINFNYAQRVIAVPVVQAATANACTGSSATLNVQNPVAGITYNWYLGTGTTPLASGSSYNTDVNLAAGTYDFFVTAGRNGCESAKTKVTVTIFPAPDAPVAVAGNPKTTCPGVPVTLAVTPVAGITYKWYDAATGGNVLATNTSTYTTLATLLPGVYNYYVEAINGNSCTSTTARTVITITVNPNATAADIDVTGATAPFCAGTKAKLTASSTTVTNPVFTWYSDPALTTAVFTGPVYEPVITANVTYYVSVSGDNKCASTAANAEVVTITLNPPALASDIKVTGADAPFCANTKATLTASSTTVINPVFTWYSDPALTTAVFTGSVYEPTVTTSTTYYVTVNGDNKCPNTAANAKVVTITVNPPALASDITVTGADAPFCAGTKAKLTASSTTVINPVFTWYSDPSLTTAVFTGAIYEPVVTATTTYYVTVRGANNCENTAATAKAVTLTVNPPATAADLTVTGNNGNFCAGSTASLVASSTTVTNPVFTWYTDAALTNAVYTGDTFNTGILNGTVTYYVTVRGTNRCENTAATAKAVTLTVNPPATSADIAVTGADAPFCGGAKANLVASSATVNSPVFTWYTDAALTNSVFVGPVFTPDVTTTTTYYVTVSGSNKCANARGDAKIVTLTVNPPALASDVIVSGADQPFCAGTAVSLNASSTTVTSPVFTWYTDAALTNAIFTGPVLTRTLTVTTTYYVTVKGANKCENASGTGKAITVTINPLPDVPVITNAGASICSGDMAVLKIQNPQAGVTYQWYDAAVGGTLLTTGTEYTTLALNTTTDYYVLALSSTGCGSATGRVKATVTVSPKPNVPSVASAAVSTCSGSTAVLSVLNPQTGVSYNWYATANSTVILGTGTSFTTPAITGTTTFYVEAATATCISTSRTPVTVTALALPVPPASVSNTSASLCSGGTSVLTVNNPDAALTYRWYSVPTGGAMLAEGTSFTTPALTTTTTYYVGSVSTVGGCLSTTRTAVVVTVLPKLAAPVVTVQSNNATSITFSWLDVPGATGYEVSVDGGPWLSPSSGPAGTTHLVAGLKPDQAVSIKVRASGQLACQLSDASSLNTKSDNPIGNQIYIPNTFTPNNDGKNDFFYVYGNTIAKMRLRVYNQWGQFIFESTNIQSGWDGTYKGEKQPNGVYVYLLEAELNDGTKTTKKGTITLLR